jgi:hypothetical protein
VVGYLEKIAEELMQYTGLFQNGDYKTSQPRMQNGVARTNCIDCLDRTNAAQFVVGKRALGHQLHALGVIGGYTLQYESDVVNIFTHMFHAHGDTIAIQYGGSHLAHTLSTYRKLNEWKNHSRDMVESFKRYYHNSFLDSQRQEAYNLFLGNFTYTQGQPMLWDLATDYYLHHMDPRGAFTREPRDYINWYTPEYLEERKLPGINPPGQQPSSSYAVRTKVEDVDSYWLEYYRPLAISSFAKMFSWKLSSRPRYLGEIQHSELSRNPSPFVPRIHAQLLDAADSPGKTTTVKGRKGHVTIVEPASDDIRSVGSNEAGGQDGKPDNEGVGRARLPGDRSQWTLKQWYDHSLAPTVTEEDEYEAYISHPLNVPLVTRVDEPDAGSYTDFAAYISRGWPAGTISHVDSELDANEEDVADFAEFLAISEKENALTVSDEDGGRKRYKAYRQWLRGKSFFKQSKVDPEYRAN